MRTRNGRLILTIDRSSSIVLPSWIRFLASRRLVGESRGSRAVRVMTRGKGGEKEQSSSKQPFVFRVFPLQNIIFLIIPPPFLSSSPPSLSYTSSLLLSRGTKMDDVK